MTLPPPRFAHGTKVGPYEVTFPLGAGGMGEVYRARDARLGRDVALKVLPALLASDPERLARFTREAQVLASLNHAGIAAIYGLEETGDTKALVLELVEGPTLAQRLAEGPMPIDEALQSAAAIAEALDAAHEQGVVHRDLKPANVKIRPDGVVKVLDFGLAKALDATQGFGGADASLSPTLTAQATRSGIILGTAAYMSPEQAKGKPVDRRADIWAFGVVLYEMLTGKRLFDGETPSEVLAQVILKEPDLSPLPAATPAHVRHLLQRCLERDPKTRLRDIGEAKLALQQPSSMLTSGGTLIAPASGLGMSGIGTAPGGASGVSAGAASRRGAPAWVTALLGLALAAALAALGWLALHPAPRPPVARYDVQVPKEISYNLSNRPALALSSDGSLLAYIGSSEGVSRLYVRRRDEAVARAVPGSDGASNPVFSPDGRWIAYTSENQLRKSSIDGSPIALAPVSDARGIAWIDSANLLYAPEPISGLLRIPATGGTPQPVTTLDDTKEERTHRWPEVLPGGMAALFTVGNVSSPDNYDAATLEAVDLKSGARKVILRGSAMARFVPPSTLVYARAGALYGIRFDPDRLETRGDPVALVQGIATDTPTGATHFAYGGDGTLAYISGSDRSGRGLFWVDRAGAAQPIDVPTGIYNDVRLSPDRARVACAVGSTGSADIWVYDFARSTFTRLTFTSQNGTPLWSPDGRTIVYAEIDPRTGNTKLRRVQADGSRPPEELIALEQRTYLYSMWPDGGSVLAAFSTRTQNRKSDLLRVPLAGGGKPLPVATTEWDEYNATLSPNARYVAYQANDTGREEVYVRDAAGTGGRWQVSTLGGEEPSWSADGTELFYRNEDRLMVVPVQTAAGFTVGVPKLLFSGVLPMRSDTGISYDVDSARKRFVMIRLAANADPNTGLRVVVNWKDELERLMEGAH